MEELLSQMTLEEKIGQMNLESPSIVGAFDVPFEELIEMMMDGRISKEEFGRIMSEAETDMHEEGIRKGELGALMVNDPDEADRLQKIALSESRLGIPLLIGYDVIHGHHSVFPIAIAEGGSFDLPLMEKTAAMAASEARKSGINWVFSPMLDLARDARWGRVSEGAGEDPFLLSAFARAKIRGLQGGKASDRDYVAACPKHYVGYGACEAGRDYNTTSIAPHLLHNMYLPPFRAAAEEGAKSTMAAFNDLNGIPCTVNRYLLRDLLKGKLGMEGLIVSDANAIRECIIHGICEDDPDAARKAALAGMDMDMGSEIYLKNLKELCEKGIVPMEVIDDAVRRILQVKIWLGLFEDPYVKEKIGKGLPAENRALCLTSAEESIVLLKNDNRLLPLDPGLKVSLLGTLADQKEEICGAWAMAFDKNDCVSILDGCSNAFPNLRYFPFGGPEDFRDPDAAIREAVEYGDVCIAVLGETVAMSGEASSRGDISLPGQQRAFLEKLLMAGKPLVLVLMNGRPLLLDWEAQHVPAIVEGWHLGVEMGNAIANVLTGKKNPEGKLTSSFPAAVGQCPIYYNHPNTGRPASKSKFSSRYLDIPVEPLYPFGYGLSYTEYEYRDLRVSDEGSALSLSVFVKNSGVFPGRETVLFFLRDVTGSLVRPVKELKAFSKVELEPGEEREVQVSLPKKQMGFYDNEGHYRLEDGLFQIFAGRDSRDCLMQEISVAF